ncbi:MAG: hypothetical protein J2P38_10075 [Candidatus Dormibacteraeota bacterium]|nr:hypothetical protein [Candidatus Dormibacteraeota bacterium]
MTFALATVGYGMPQVLGVVAAVVLALRGRHRAPRAARYALVATVIELLLVVADLALLGGVDLFRSVSYGTEVRVSSLSYVLVLLSVLTLAPLLFAVQMDRNLRLPVLGRRAPPAPTIPPRTRSRWEQVLPRADDHAGRPPGPRPPRAR